MSRVSFLAVPYKSGEAIATAIHSILNCKDYFSIVILIMSL